MSHLDTNVGEELVVAGILSRLPVKSILRFMCVSKSWQSLISSSYFISSQLGNSNAHAHLIVHQCDARIRAGRPTKIRLFNLDGSNRYPPMCINFGFESPRTGHLFVVGSVRGLICYAAVETLQVGVLSKFIIFNPEIRSVLSVAAPLPSVAYYSVVKGFGFDDVGLDHLIFVAAPNRSVYLFSLNSNSWRCMPCRSSWDTKTGNAIFVKGCFYWLSCEIPPSHRTPNQNYEPAVMVFNIRSETFRRIPFQQRLPSYLRIMAGFGESSIAIVQLVSRPNSFVSHVWMMNRNGSWIKIANDVRAGRTSEEKEVLGFKSQHELLIRAYSRRVIVSQNIKNRKLRSVMSTEPKLLHCTLHTHVPSLVYSIK